MSKLRVSDIQPEGATTNLTLGTSGDSVTVASTQLRTNTFKDVGGNNMWTSDGSGNLSNVNSALSGGGMTLLSTANADGSSADLRFTSTYINSTYNIYMVVVDAYYPTTNSRTLECNFSVDNGSNWIEKTTAFTKAYLAYDNSTSGIMTEQGWSVGNSQNWFECMHDSGGDHANGEAHSGIMWIFNPSSATFNTNFIWRGENFRSNSRMEDSMVTGYCGAASINCVAFRSANPYTMYGTFKLYGVA